MRTLCVGSNQCSTVNLHTWFKIVLCLKKRGQYRHPYGFSFVCIRKCCVRWLCCLKRFPHSGREMVTIRLFNKYLLFKYDGKAAHCRLVIYIPGHGYGRDSMWMQPCCNSVVFCLNSFWQIGHRTYNGIPAVRPCWMISGNRPFGPCFK